MTDQALKDRKSTLQVPKRWGVFIMHDPIIPIEFNVSILLTYFGMDVLFAHRHASEVMSRGRTLAGVFTFEVAETKLSLVAMVARQNGLPLRLVLEPISQ